MKIDSSNPGDVNEIGDESGIAEKPSRAQRKRLRKKMLKEEAARRKKVIGPLLPTEMLQAHDGISVGDAGGSNFEEEDSDGDEEETSGSISNICSQLVRPNAQEKKQGTHNTAFDFLTISLVSNLLGKIRTYLTRFHNHLYEIQIKGLTSIKFY